MNNSEKETSITSFTCGSLNFLRSANWRAWVFIIMSIYKHWKDKNQKKLIEVEKKMTENEEKKGKQPDYRGKLDVAAWINKDKNDKAYLSVKLDNKVNLFKNEPKPKEEPSL